MESPRICAPFAAPAHDSTAAGVEEEKGKDNQIYEIVDQFLVEAIENPRHRLTVMRMELDIQRFMRNSDLQQFEFHFFPTSYLRCAAHRVAQHYGLQTVALDYTADGLGSRIVARKTPESKFPAICLSDIPTKQQPEGGAEKVKIAIRPREGKPYMSAEVGIKRNTVRTVEEREEEYDKARARIFNGSYKPDVGMSFTSVADDHQGSYRVSIDSAKDGAARVAIFRDREKDMTDPDYDRNYSRYVKSSAPSHNFGPTAGNVLQPLSLQFQQGISHIGQIPSTQPPVSYRPLGPNMNTICPVGCNHMHVYMQWPTPAIMYAESDEQFKLARFQVPPMYQQPLSFERWQNH